MKIEKLKELFTEGSSELRKDYWTPELLELYSQSLGERIRWKWQHFLRDLRAKGRHFEDLFPGQTLEFVDWGCGSGTASAAVFESFQDPTRATFSFHDRSALAVSFARERLAQMQKTPAASAPTRKVLLISYVLTELSRRDLDDLVAKTRQHEAFCWIDSGAFAESRQLSELRNTLLGDFAFLSPCPHQELCPLSGKNHPQDWCHRFAVPPQEVFHSAQWAEWSKSLKIDLRSLPYASLFAVKKTQVAGEPKNLPERLGRPRVGKHEAILDFCTPAGTYEQQTLSKRQNPEEFKRLKKEL